MRYWGWFAAKVLVCGAAMYGLLALLNYRWPARSLGENLAGDLTHTLMVGLWFLVSCGGFYLCVLDQRYRCRVCLRRLRMPVESGSWGRMLFLGRPQIEYICPYGHGTLTESELHIYGIENPEWTPGMNLWEDLCAAGKEDEKK